MPIGGARVPYVVKEEDRAKVARLVVAGVNQATIARVLDISTTTLAKYFRNELDKSNALVLADVAESLLNAAKQAHTCQPAAVAAGKFFLNTRGRWTTQESIEITDPDSKFRELSPEGRDAMRKVLREEKKRQKAAAAAEQEPLDETTSITDGDTPTNDAD